MQFLRLTLLFAGSIPAFSTIIGSTTSDTFNGGGCNNYGSSSASCFYQSNQGGDGYGQQKGAISMAWINPLQIEVKGWYYEWYNPSIYSQYPSVGRTTDSIRFSIPSTWGNYSVTGFVHDQFNTGDTGPSSLQIGQNYNTTCAITGTSGWQNESCSFAHTSGVVESLGITGVGIIDQFNTSEYGWFDVKVSDPPAASATPEPSSLALMGLSIVGTGFALRKKLKH